MKVIIDPRLNIQYCSFYIQGLSELYGRKKICYRLKPFRTLPSFDGMLFVIRKGTEEKRYCIQTGDSYEINQACYDWCDVYGNVNANFEHCPKEQFPKLVSLVPSFGISYYGLIDSILLAVDNFLKAPMSVLKSSRWNKVKQKMEVNPYKNFRRFFGLYVKTCTKLLPLKEYDNDLQSRDDYIFFLSTLWYSDQWNQNDKGVNLRRHLFVNVVKSIDSYGVIFRGGLVGDADSCDPELKSSVVSDGLPLTQWLRETKLSALVFNTPAFWNCHGWKLGEYLAMGKCIVSTPLSNDLPFPLEHGVNIHFVDGSEESIKQAVVYILAHPDYRRKLEYGARDYWEKYGTPLKSLEMCAIKK